jgi:hypothetical protein
MALFNITHERYYNNSASFTGDGSTRIFEILESQLKPRPTEKATLDVYVDGKEINVANYTYNDTSTSPPTPFKIVFTGNTNNTDVLESNGAPKNGLSIVAIQINAEDKLGSYQFITLKDIINNFMVSYVGEEKIIPKVKRSNVLFFAQRAIQELSYDTFKSEKSQEIEVPTDLQMKLPHDYVNYVKLSWVDGSGAERTLYPAIKTSNPTPLLQDDLYNYLFDSQGNLLTATPSETWKTFQKQNFQEETKNDLFTDKDNAFQLLHGQRFGSAPEYMNSNGLFFIDNVRGKIFFSSHVSGKVITLKYISDGVATEEEKLVHKFAEEAMYKSIAHAILATRQNTPEYLVARFKRERFAATRQAKLRLSNLKAEELTQTLRAKSKWIKH